MFRPTQGHPQANKEHTRNNKMSTQWDAISFNSGYYKIYCVGSIKNTVKIMIKYARRILKLHVLRSTAPLYVH
jgi:hypothetical protein